MFFSFIHKQNCNKVGIKLYSWDPGQNAYTSPVFALGDLKPAKNMGAAADIIIVGTMVSFGSH